jgi:hypothetical protein
VLDKISWPDSKARSTVTVGYCGKHDPEATAVRRTASAAKSAEKWARAEAAIDCEETATKIVKLLHAHLNEHGQIDWVECSERVTKLVKKYAKLEEKAKP